AITFGEARSNDRHRKKLRRRRLPSPHSVNGSRPQFAVTILIQPVNAMVQPAVIPVALNPDVANGADPAVRACNGPLGRPYSSLVILDDRQHGFSSKLRVVGHLTAVPTGKPFIGSNPKPAVSCGQQAANAPAR